MIVIKDMEMPSSCYDCPFAKNERTNDYGSYCECGILEDYETINLLEHSKHPNCPLIYQEPVLDKVRAEILEEKESAYADFERYKVEYLGQDQEDVLDSLPQDDFRYGMERAIEIIDKYKSESEK